MSQSAGGMTLSEIDAFLADAAREYALSITDLAGRCARLSANVNSDADEAAATADAVAALLFQKRALENSTAIIAQIDGAVRLYLQDRDRYQARMDSLARRLYETKEQIEIEFAVVEDQMNETECLLGFETTPYIDLVRAALTASETGAQIAKHPEAEYPSTSLFDGRGALFNRWRMLFVRVSWEFTELVEGLETCLDIVGYVERTIIRHECALENEKYD